MTGITLLKYYFNGLFSCNISCVYMCVDDGSSAAVIYRSVQEKPCLGMLSWQPSDLPLILKSVILGIIIIVHAPYTVCHRVMIDLPCRIPSYCWY